MNIFLHLFIKIQQVVETVSEKLYTLYGMRMLEEDDAEIQQ